MAYQVSKPVKVPAKGDAPQRKPGPTPAPTKKYQESGSDRTSRAGHLRRRKKSRAVIR